MAGNISLWCFMISSLCINNSVGVHVFMTVFQPRRVWLTDNNSMLDQHWKTQRRTFAASGSHNYLWPGTTYFMNTQITNLRPEAFRVTCSPATRFTVQITGVNRDKMVTITELDIKIWPRVLILSQNRLFASRGRHISLCQMVTSLLKTQRGYLGSEVAIVCFIYRWFDFGVKKSDENLISMI